MIKKKEGLGYLINWLIRLGDICLINLVFVFLYFFLADKISSQFRVELFLLINLIYFVAASIIPLKIASNIIFFDRIIQRSFSFITLYFILFTVGFYIFILGHFSFEYWLLSYAILMFSYLLWHVLIRSVLKWYRRKGYNYKRVVIVGNGSSAVGIYNELKSNDYGYRILGIFGDIPESECIATDINYLGDITEVEKYCFENNIDEIFCTLANSEESVIVQLVNFAEHNMIRFYLVPDFYSYIRRKLVLSSLQSTPVIAIRPEPLQNIANQILKRVFDVVFSLIVLVTIFPVIYFIFGLLIKISSKGPIIFRQQRTGLHGKVFTCFKFRTMVLNDDSERLTTLPSDSRITFVGAFMRRTSMDELPQFFNVLIGNMSIVGPRPHMVKETDRYNQLIDKFMIRHLIKPGITGWAQISGYRGETRTIEQMEGRIKRDVWYLENWSFALDLKIIAVTTYQVLKGDDKAF